MNETLIWLILAVAALNAVLTIVSLLRGARASRAAEEVLRAELRDGRDEARTAGKELREEVSAGLRSTGATLSKTLEGLGTG